MAAAMARQPLHPCSSLDPDGLRLDITAPPTAIVELWWRRAAFRRSLAIALQVLCRKP